MHTPTPFLWFHENAEKAAEFYVSIFSNSKILSRSPMVTVFELNGQKMMAMNGGPDFTFNEAVSFMVNVDTQEEVDYYWSALTKDGGKEGQCGWLKDKYGLSWQIIPTILPKLMSGENREGATRATNAMMQMKKIVIAELERAYEGKL